MKILTPYVALLLAATTSQTTTNAESYAIAKQIEEDEQLEKSLATNAEQVKLNFQIRELDLKEVIKQESFNQKKYLPHHKRGGSKFI